MSKEDKNYLQQVLAANILQTKFLGNDVRGFVRIRKEEKEKREKELPTDTAARGGPLRQV